MYIQKNMIYIKTPKSGSEIAIMIGATKEIKILPRETLT